MEVFSGDAACLTRGPLAIQLSWFRADVKFGCPSCGKVSTEAILAHARDLSAMPVAIVDRVTLTCQMCKTVCPDRAPFEIVIRELTAEELANLQVEYDTSSRG